MECVTLLLSLAVPRLRNESEEKSRANRAEYVNLRDLRRTNVISIREFITIGYRNVGILNTVEFIARKNHSNDRQDR